LGGEVLVGEVRQIYVEGEAVGVFENIEIWGFVG
jgi:hypothetical protein